VPEVGVLYMIGEPGLPDSCLLSTHVEFSWSETGEQGPPGPQGEQGPAGPQGEQGPAGPAGVDGVQLDDIFPVGGQVDIQPGETGTAVAQCPAGRRPVSGNYSAASLTVFAGGVSYGVLNQFAITARNDVGQTVTLWVTAHCVISP
jgi:hypothetical protein